MGQVLHRRDRFRDGLGLASLSELNLFEGVDRWCLEHALPCIRVFDLEDGQTVDETEQASDAVFLVLEGALVERSRLDGRIGAAVVGSPSHPAGTLEGSVPTRWMGPGTAYGHFPMLTGPRIWHQTRAVAGTRVLMVDASAVQILCESSPRFMDNLIRLLDRRPPPSGSVPDHTIGYDRYTGLPTGDRALALIGEVMHRCTVTMHYACLLALDPGFSISSVGPVEAQGLVRGIRSRLRGYDILCSRGPRRLIVLLPETRSDVAAGIADRLLSGLGEESPTRVPAPSPRAGVVEMVEGETPWSLVAAAEDALRTRDDDSFRRVMTACRQRPGA